MGDQGTLLISESEASYPGRLYRDPNAPRLGRVDPEGLRHGAQDRGEGREEDASVLDVRESVSPDEHRVPVVLRDPYHQPHLQNFFDAVRGKASCTAPRRSASSRRPRCSR
jgi:hypothetical protein